MNKQKLKAAMILAGETQATMADKLGMQYASLNYRINGRLDFKASEIREIAKILGLTPSGIIAIFFEDEVENSSTEGE
jgi:transcriptional regulator with XRE-family HTH domain